MGQYSRCKSVLIIGRPLRASPAKHIRVHHPFCLGVRRICCHIRDSIHLVGIPALATAAFHFPAGKSGFSLVIRSMISYMDASAAPTNGGAGIFSSGFPLPARSSSTLLDVSLHSKFGGPYSATRQLCSNERVIRCSLCNLPPSLFKDSACSRHTIL